MARRRLPIGIQTFREVRETDCYYVDKTPYIQRLLEEGKHYFLSRPRRFGKSLFLDTLKELFEGNAGLFEGLAIHDRWDWSVRHPVVRLSFGGGDFKRPGHVEASLMEQLAAVERDWEIEPAYATAAGRFVSLLKALHERAGRPAAVLVDEYDKPILDALEEPEPPAGEQDPARKGTVARANRDFLRGLYGAIKDADAHIRFTFLTGVSRFSKVSLFSGLNNLIDITLDPGHAGICGYTDADIDTVFEPELCGLDRERIRDWYNGYNWLGQDKLYNPFDVLLLLPAMRATMPASSTRTSRRWDWTSRWKTAAVTVASTWRCTSTATSICSSSRSWNCRRRARPWPSYGQSATRTGTAPPASPFT